MKKIKILSKFNIDMKDYNNELEKILENKLFSYDVKNLLLSMLYKIENAYKDYETVKRQVPTKKEYIENILRIIKEKCLKIFLVKAGTAEAEELEKNNLLFKIDKKNGEIICFQNELIILTAILELDSSYITLNMKYEYLEEPLTKLIEYGNIESNVEVIRDFNGWSWDIVTKEIKNIEFNFIYQTLLLINGIKNINNKKYANILDIATKMTVNKYIEDEKNKEYFERIKKIKDEKQERLELFNNKKELITKITNEKKEYSKQIEKIDKLLNNDEALRKEYYSRNKKLPSKEKIFSISFLVDILNKERLGLIKKIEECNKIILPKEFIEQKNKLEEEIKFLNDIFELDKNEYEIKLCNEFLKIANDLILKINEENKQELINWIYKIRYYRYIPISNIEYIKDIKQLEPNFKKIIELILRKAENLKVWDEISNNEEVTYNIVKEVFNMKMICLQSLNIQFKYENKILYADYYDGTIIETTHKLNANNVRIKKKVKLFI